MKKIKRRELIAGVGAATVAGAMPASANTDNIPKLSLPLMSNRLISNVETAIEGGKETRGTMEFVGANGVREVHTFLRRAIGPNRTTTLHTAVYASHEDSEPACVSTMTIFAQVVGKKVTITVSDASGIHPDGTITIKDDMASFPSFEGLSDQEIVDAVLAKKGLRQ